MSGNALESARKAKLFLCGRLDAHTGNIYAAGVGNMRAHAVNIAAQLGLLRDDGRINVDNGIAVFAQYAHDLPEQQQAVRAEKTVVSIGEQLADIAQRSRAEQRVGNRVVRRIRDRFA